jgi:diguanylate cyclase (GGDEF)-like protein
VPVPGHRDARRWLEAHLTPRDPRATARAGTALLSTAVVLNVVADLLARGDGHDLLRISVTTVLALFLAAYLRTSASWWPLLAAALPLVTTVLILVVAVPVGDASAGAQAFLCIPVLYAAWQFPPGTIAVTTVAAVGADVALVLAAVPGTAVLTDLMFVPTVMVTIALLLGRAGRAQDVLVAQLRRMATVDPLTGLLTRRALDEASRTALRSSARRGGTALLLLDVDRFKTINDTHGHPVGDRVLVHIAGVLAGQALPDAVSARLGGDEVAVLLPGCTAQRAERSARALHAAIAATPLELAGGSLLPVSVSVGVAHAADDADDLEDLYAAADVALYEAKRAGRGRVAVAEAGSGPA